LNVIATGFGRPSFSADITPRANGLERSAVPADALNLIAESDPLKTRKELKRSSAVEVARAKTRRP
jgi:hypothetical protein